MVAVITSGGSEFGECMAKAYAEEGASIVIADMHKSHGMAVVHELKGKGQTALFVKTDVSKNADMAHLVARTMQHFERLDVMVNSAGMSHPNQFMLEVSEEFYDRLFAVNVKSIYLSVIHCAPIFRKKIGLRDQHWLHCSGAATPRALLV